MHIARTLGSVSIVLALVGSAACAGGETTTSAAAGPHGAVREGQQDAVPVSVAPVVHKTVPVQITAVGTAQPHLTVQVHAQITGQLQTMNFKEGDEVSKGQVLFTLDKRPLEAALQQAQANLEKDLAQAANAKVQAVRYQDLLKRGIATHEQADQMTSSAAALNAAVDADKAAVENAEVQLQYATIAAPIAGRTGALQVDVGNLVRATDTTPLVVINQIAPIDVDFAVPEARMAEVRRYLAAGTIHVDAQPPANGADVANGRITFIDNQIDQTTGTIKLKASFANADRALWPGEFLNVRVTLTTHPDAIVVPTSAVQSGQQGQYVYVAKPDGTVELRAVTVAQTSPTETVIASGLRPGETVVTDGQLRLVSGSRISVKGAGGRATP